MDEQTRAAFEAVFASHEQMLEQRRQARIMRDTAEQQFIQSFRERSTSTYRPAMERIGAYLLTKGMRSDIVVTQKRTGFEGREDSHEALVFRITLGEAEQRGHRPLHEQPHLALMPDKLKKEVELHQNTNAPGRGGASTIVGSVKLEQLTEELLEQKVLVLVRELLSTPQ